ncbi:protein phosphatase 2C domain-containing protein [Xanthomonas perforans]
MLQLGEASGTVPVPVEGGPALALSWHALTDVGHRRSLNEDSLLAVAPVFAVADGMGGHDSGDVASAAVVRRLGELASDGLTSIDEIGRALARATLDIHEGEIAGGRGSGTTVTGAALVAEEGTPYLAIVNLGDSRVYAAEGSDFARVTVDHSVVQAMVDAGMITEAEAEHHPDSNVITRAIGAADSTADSWLLPVINGERMLICSDGLTGEVADEGIRMTLTMSGRPESAAQALVERAKANGGRDNITVVIVDVLGGGADLPSDETTNSLLRSTSLDGHDTELVDDTIPVRVR